MDKKKEMEKLMKHKNFISVKEYDTFYEVLMKSKVFNNRKGSIKGSNYYTVDKKKIVDNETYKVYFQKSHK
jgi:hypothetical protein